MNLKLTISYLGTNYLGVQKTPHGNSIEEELERALFQILRNKVYLQFASRTDAGVHARGQIVSFFSEKQIDLQKLQYSLNGILPKDLQVESIEEVSSYFHPSLDSLSKTYSYQICNSSFQLPFKRFTSWHCPYKTIDLELLRKAAAYFIGKFDFRSFSPLDYENPLCTIEEIVSAEENQQITITITGDRFLYKMIRTLVGTLVNLSTGKIPFNEINTILENKQRKLAGVTAPPIGLCLEMVSFTLPLTTPLVS